MHNLAVEQVRKMMTGPEHPKLLDSLEQTLMELDCMAAVTTEQGAIVVSNPLFRAFFTQVTDNICHIPQLRPLFDTGHPTLDRVRLLTMDDRSLMALRLPVPEHVPTNGRKLSLVVFADVSSETFELTAAKAVKERMELLELILDASAEGLMFVNPEGIITYINKSYERIHHVKAENVIGHHVTEIIENTRMHLVVKTGIPEIADFQLESKRRYIVSRIPVFKGTKVIGAIGEIIFRDFDKVDALAFKLERLRKQLEFYRNQPDANPDIKYTAEDIVAVSPRSSATKATALRVAPSDSTVLLLGESGVGKEVYAHAIHATSPRARGPFIRVNCSAIVESLFESELFGYAEGAFTGASKGGKRGKFELANMGTIFLDEIADMPLEAQAKLLRVLQEQEVEKLGGGKQIKVDVRVIAATNQDLERLVQEGKFRKDLYFRINVIPIVIPPLRQRVADIPELVDAFWDKLTKAQGVYYKTLSDDAMVFLENYAWPGNVRELHNLLARAIAVVQDDTITADQLRMLLQGGVAEHDCQAPVDKVPLAGIVEMAERRAISTALARCNNNRAQAAKLLGITRPLLYKKMHQFGIQ